MEFFKNAKLIRLRSHTNKYLIADNDQETVLQSSNISTNLTHWTVESVNSSSHLIQLKSVHGLYLTVTEESVLFGREVIQAKFSKRGLIDNATVQWEPIKEGVFIKLRCNVVGGGMFLKGNGGLPPWRNTVTADVSDSDKSVLWRVELVESTLFNVSTVSKELIISNADLETAVSDRNPTLGKALSFSPIRVFRRKQRGGSSSSIDMDSTSPSMAARASFLFSKTFKSSSKSLRETSLPEKAPFSDSFSIGNTFKRTDHHLLRETSSSNSLLHEAKSYESDLELFSNAKIVRLRSHHNKYLVANDDEENVRQGRRGSSKSARWNVEFVEGTNMIRLRSCYEKYLTTTEESLLMFGKKVMQTSRECGSSAEWEPFREGTKIKLKNRNGNFLNANGGSAFWKNTVTHDLPQRTAFQDWILWDVEILEIIPQENVEHENDEEQDRQQTEYESEETQSRRRNSTTSDDNNLPYESSESDSQVSLPSHTSSKFETNRSFQSEGRLIYYKVIKNEVEVDDDYLKGCCCINFKGNGLEELKEILGEKSGLRNFIMCLRNGLNGELYPIKLQLPPNKTSMCVFLVPSSS